MTTTNNTLSTCPFCGERAETYFIPERHSYQIECSDVFGCTARVTRDSEQAAIEAWNLRAPAPAASEALITIESSLRFRLACAKDDAAQLEIENRKLREVAALSMPARVPLADEQIEKLCAEIGFTNWPEWDGGTFQEMWMQLARAIEAAHGITAAQGDVKK